MPRGGARVNSGPPPDPNALRRDRKGDKDGWTTLPVKRDGPVPPWPLAEPSRAMLKLWGELWETPQAVMWERMGWTHEVAVYATLLSAVVVIDDEGLDLKRLSEARMWSDRLGLNPAAMLRNRWRVAEDETKAARERKPVAGSSMRDRVRVVNGGA